MCGRAAAILTERPDEFAHLLTLEMGKLYAESLGEVALTAQILAYYAENAETFLAPNPSPPQPGRGRRGRGQHPARSDPRDTAVELPVLPAGPGRSPQPDGRERGHGQTCLERAAGGGAFERLLLEAGAPEGAYTNLYATKDQISTLIDDPRVRGVALTGSEAAGAIVASRAGGNLKKSTMELGGTDALIALADAELDKTVQWALWGRMNNGGQCCVASSDHRGRRDRRQVPRAIPGGACRPQGRRSLRRGDHAAPDVESGRRRQLNAQIKAAVEAGATAIPLGEPVPTSGAFVQPTILTDITPDNPAYYQEFFGPVALFFGVDSEDEAVRLANDSHYGLGGSVFTQDVAHGVEVAKRIDTGMVFINHPTWTRADLPFGGVKMSGYGHELAGFGIQEFVNKKLINVVPIDAPA